MSLEVVSTNGGSGDGGIGSLQEDGLGEIVIL